jgi:CrcB protein
MIGHLLQVALGGAIGASARYLLGLGVMRWFGLRELPLGVLTTNIAGSFLMGVLVHLLLQRGLNHLAPFLMIGLLGGFTTFSSFSLEAVNLLEKGAFGLAALYVGLSVGGAILGLMAGLWLMRSMT